LFFVRNNESKLLERKNEIEIKNEEIEIIDKSLNKIFNYYKNNKEKIIKNQNNLIINDSLNKNNELFNEYILALKDENRYKAAYNEKINSLVF
jgi:hypothetical protein